MEMTDRELLELAAKAAGFPISEGYCEEIEGCAWWVYLDGSGEPPNDSAWTELWNPLEEDGDALRLAVKLGLIVEVSQQDRWTFISYTCCDSKPSVSEKHHADSCSATRRAIVRAAAEIGKAKP